MTTSMATNTFEFRLPDIGEGVVEGELVAWLVKPGDSLVEDQPMFEVMTDKATVEIPSPRKGRVVATFGTVGEIIKVGDVVVAIEMAAGESAPIMHGAPAEQRIPPPNPPLPGGGGTTSSPTSGTPLSSPPTSGGGQGGVTSQPESKTNGKVFATPATRKLARDLGVDLYQVPGTGPQGRVTKADVAAFHEGGVPRRAAVLAPQPIPTVHPELEERVPMRGLRKKIAEKMVQSAFTAPHFTYMDELDATKLIALRAEAKKAAEAEGVKLSYLPFIMKAVVAALKKYPTLNATFDDAAQELVIKRYYNLGVAVAGENGLIVPVIKDVDRKSILQLAREIAEVAERARLGRNHPEELKGGTFTLSSIGNVGGLFATPIINYPEVGILAVMKIQERPVVRQGQIVVGQMMNMALSFDHRVVDGAVGAAFTNEVIRYLEKPSQLMIEMV